MLSRLHNMGIFAPQCSNFFPKEQRFCPAEFGRGEFFGRNNLVVNALWTWGVLRAEQFGGECVFVGISECDISMIRRGGAIMWEFHMTLFGGECVFLEISECDISNDQTALYGGESVFSGNF
jgi:hypothetical protein